MYAAPRSPLHPPCQQAEWTVCRHSHKVTALKFSVASRAVPAGVRCRSTLVARGQTEDSGSVTSLASTPLEQPSRRWGNREGGERRAFVAARKGWAASAGHAGSQQPAAGNSSSKQGVAAACSRKRGGDWCSRWRDLGEDAPGRASHAGAGSAHANTPPRPLHHPGAPQQCPLSSPMKGQAVGMQVGGAQAHHTRNSVVRTITRIGSQFSPAAFPDPLSMQSYVIGPN